VRKAATILITVTAWSMLVCLHAFYSISRCMADTNCRDYEGIWILPLLGYMIYVFPIWVVGLLVGVILELVFVRDQRSLPRTEILKA
jgi:hypothetical protein